jgi:hypothetical protein
MTSPRAIATPTFPPAAAGDRSALRAVAMPTEHGGWSLTLEPVLLGLLVAWSWSGLALGAIAFLAFLARTPLKLVLVDRWRRRWLPRSGVAARVALLELAVMSALLLAAAVGTADRRWWVPLLAAVPLVSIELWFDMRSRGRRLVPELAGTIGIGSVAAAIALADGRSAALALGLWCVVAARAAAAVPYARTQVLRGRGKPTPRWPSDLAQVLALAAVVVGTVLDAVPLASTVVVAVIAAINVAAVRLAPRPAKVIGIQQMCFGLAVVIVTAVAVVAR